MVVQEDEFGCGVACVANLLGISYRQALKLFDNPKDSKNKGFWCRDIITALQNAVIDSTYKYIKSSIKNQIYKSGTIVFVTKDKRYPAGHYLLRMNLGWNDSWINFPLYPRKVGLRKRLPGKPICMLYIKR